MDSKKTENFNFSAIGYVESCYKDKFGVPRQSGLVKNSVAKIKLRSDLQPEQSLAGLEGFSHIWIIFVFHQNVTSRFHAKVHPPRLQGKPMGLFATRTPHRPNPIGLSLVELIKIEKDTLEIRGIDLVDGTPVLDIKPYMPEIEAKSEAEAGWTCRLETKPIGVEFSTDAELSLQSWQSNSHQANLRQLIIETISLDPRPVVYRGYENQDSPYRAEHAIRLFDGDIHFKFIRPDQAQITKIVL